MVKRIALGLVALFSVALAAPSFVAAQGISQRVATCDPAYPSRCLKPDANGAIAVAGGISVNSAAVATAAAPSYVEGTSNPLSMDLSGNLRTSGSGGGGGGASAKATAAAPSYVEGATVDLSVNLTGDLRSISKQSGVWNIGTVTDVTTVGAISTPVGIKGADGSSILSNSNPVPISDGAGSITVDGTVSAVQSGTWNLTNISGTVSLPTGAATSALQSTGNSSLATIATNTGSATPAGTNVIGRVGIDQTTPGTTNLVAAGQSGTWNLNNISGTVSLPTGAATAANQSTANGSLSSIVTNTTGLATAAAQTTANGYLSNISAAALDTTPATVNITQIAGASVPVGSGAAATAMRVELPNDGTGKVGLNAGSALIGGVKLTDTGGTTNATVKAASTQAATTDTSLVVAQSPNANTLCTSSVAISQTTSTDVLTLTDRGHICSIILVSDTAQFINVITGTGTVCATGGAALIGSTTAGNGLSVSANGGFSAVSDRAWIRTPSAVHLCVTQSGSGRLSGVITYSDQS